MKANEIKYSLFSRRQFLNGLLGGSLGALVVSLFDPVVRFIFPPYKEPDQVILPWADFSDLAPYPLQLSRDRVSDENAPVRLLDPQHPVLTYPNAVTASDFDGWVQERGLYFPDQWDESYTPVLSMNDPGEPERKGSLLVAPYGEGHYIYPGLSFFREMPEGVSGAFKLFANMLSIGKANLKTDAVKG